MTSITFLLTPDNGVHRVSDNNLWQFDITALNIRDVASVRLVSSKVIMSNRRVSALLYIRELDGADNPIMDPSGRAWAFVIMDDTSFGFSSLKFSRAIPMVKQLSVLFKDTRGNNIVVDDFAIVLEIDSLKQTN
jgi:hypothetical protein